jgi:hypothetical protein
MRQVRCEVWGKPVEYHAFYLLRNLDQKNRFFLRTRVMRPVYEAVYRDVVRTLRLEVMRKVGIRFGEREPLRDEIGRL